MIIRKLADAIREQNWFTVIIEILIVVIGIFLGLQVTEWNEDRKAKNTERLILAQLKEEFIEIKYNLERQIATRNGPT